MCNRHHYLKSHYIGSVKVGLRSVMSPRIVKILVSPVVMFYGNVKNGIAINILLNAKCLYWILLAIKK